MESTTIDIARAQSIAGWMNNLELAWLGFQATQRSNIVEIGSFLGRSTRVLADNASGDVSAVDLWKYADEYKDLLGDMTDEQFFAKFRENLAGTDVFIYRMDSIAAAKKFSDSSFDMVFIDGSHDYKSVKEDILAWKPLIAPGGLLCGHDFGYPGVTQAVQELLPEARIVAAYTSLWGVQV